MPKVWFNDLSRGLAVAEGRYDRGEDSENYPALSRELASLPIRHTVVSGSLADKIWDVLRNIIVII